MSYREPVQLAGRRKPLTNRQIVDIFDRAKGRCYICDLPISAKDKWTDEHIIPRHIKGEGADDVSNRAPVHVLCAREKTKKDAKDIAKTYRVRAKELGIKRRKYRWGYGKDDAFKKKINGKVVPR